MRTTTLRLLIAVALVASLHASAEPRPVTITASTVALHADGSSGDRVGRLRYRAGFHLTSGDDAFGGFSGLVVEEGGRMLAVSDQGHWLSAELVFAADGTLKGIAAGQMGALCDDDASPVIERERRDAEEIQALPGRGYLVSFERHHRIVFYEQAVDGVPSLTGPSRPFPFPPAMVTTRSNNGMEAVALLPDGRLLTFAEDLRTVEDDIIGWIGDPDRGDWRHVTLPTRDEFLPTGAATLPTGDVVLLERSFDKTTRTNSVRLTLLEARGFAPGARLEPRELALLESPLTVDNMEAVAVLPGPGGEVLIYLLSDDNYNDQQRTLLLQLELVE